MGSKPLYKLREEAYRSPSPAGWTPSVGEVIWATVPTTRFGRSMKEQMLCRVLSVAGGFVKVVRNAKLARYPQSGVCAVSECRPNNRRKKP